MIKKKFLSILMMSIIVLSLSFGISISIPIVFAGTSVVASTYAKLSISTAEDKVLRLIPKYVVNTPDLGFEAGAKATTVVNNTGPASIEQKYVAWGERNGPVHTSVSGIGLANIDPEGQADYEFGLSGSHVVKTNAVYPGIGSSANEEFERIRISFEACPIESDIPFDINQGTDLVYNIENGVLKGYGFDYFSEVNANDITCTSSMSYKKGGD
jgi:hypothetical protein